EEWLKIIKEHPYEPPSATDLRGPCPALNTLANHGFLPRDGRNITQKQLFESVVTMGVPTFIAHFISKAPFSKFKQQHPSDTVMSYLRPLKMVDFNQFGIHNAVEHDVSLSRHDANVPPFDANRFIPERFERMIRLAKKRKEEEKNHVNGNDVNDHRKLCWLESIRDNPLFSMGTNHQV
ncbi:Chloroperoxidase, partial [Circinella umbellata]